MKNKQKAWRKSAAKKTARADAVHAALRLGHLGRAADLCVTGRGRIRLGKAVRDGHRLATPVRGTPVLLGKLLARI